MIIMNYTSISDLITVNSKENYLNIPNVHVNYNKIDAVWYVYPKKPDVYVIADITENELFKTMEYLSDDLNFNPRAKYVFVLQKFSEKISSLFHFYFILNVVLIDVETSKVFTYFPYENNSLNIVNNKLVQIGFCAENGDINFESDLFPMKIPKVWHNSSISIMYYPCEFYAICDNCKDKGAEIELFNIISEHFNIETNFYRVLTLDEDIYLFNEKHYDVFFGAQKVQDFHEFTYPYYSDTLVWVVPSTLPIPRWNRFTYLLNGLNYELSIDSVAKIFSNNLKVGSTKFVKKLMNSSTEMDKYLKKNYVECTGFVCLNLTAFKRDMATLTLKRTVEAYLESFSDDLSGQWSLEELTPPMQTYYLVTFFNAGHPMFQLFNRNLLYLVESGIVAKITLKYNKFHGITKNSFNATQSLHLEHITAPMVLWFVGMVVSLLVFIGELTTNRL
ncbi:hypothetical protein HHI36_020510 [Cryptolaemus montrouzieri]|uniref:Uncharacterized protein n=1 Tax=Cryptolaemus montrouzieri TaxID=559131 RepID=A0ABD2NBI1_9CUCU